MLMLTMLTIWGHSFSPFLHVGVQIKKRTTCGDNSAHASNSQTRSTRLESRINSEVSRSYSTRFASWEEVVGASWPLKAEVVVVPSSL